VQRCRIIYIAGLYVGSNCSVQVAGLDGLSWHRLLSYWLLGYRLRYRLLRYLRLRRDFVDAVVPYRDLELLFRLLAWQYAVNLQNLFNLLRRSLSIAAPC
jgi:hypothetical protein